MAETQKFPQTRRVQGGDSAVGKTLNNRYHITAVLGVGGMGMVYLARDRNFPDVTHYVAVKEMQNTLTDPHQRQTMVEQFEREINILATLKHPAIPQIIDRFTIQDRIYLVMEYIRGKDLEAYLSTLADFVPVEVVVRWAIEICDVLHYLHSQTPPIIFRDLKPSNIMIDEHGRVRLIDFGIARKFQENLPAVTQIGTEGYAPPEQYRGRATPLNDIYSLGATLHHILTRKDPRLEPQFSFKERPIKQYNPKVPDALVQIVMRALEYNPEARFQTVDEMKQALIAVERSLHAPQGMAAPLSTLHLGSASAGTVAWGGSAELQASQLVWKFQCEDEIRGTPTLKDGVVYVGVYDNNLYAINALDGKFRWKFATEGGIATTPVVISEENLVLFGSQDKVFYAVDARTGRLAWSYATEAPIRSSPVVQHGVVFFGNDRGILYALRFNAINRTLAWKYDCGSPIRARPCVHQNFVIVPTEAGDVVCLDLGNNVKWRFNKPKRPVYSSPVVYDGVVYFGCMDMHLYGVDLQNGWGVWRQRLGGRIVGTPLIVGKNVYIGCDDNIMYALELGSNRPPLWKFTTEGQIVSSPVFANGAIYFGSGDGCVYSVETRKGQQRWKFETGGPITSSGVISENPNLLYIGSTDKHLYALNL
ncbi:MAG: PQQ-binding-like beta-propeller repeat protein [Anaerolineae bacterium]|nr:PQQ-binding-like beta-propeller repeat protein [Anaerolineae bacterium]MDW8298994.1 PQQ-binding-like beta-propeller repeat protein [Anaerolineae bacterium]